MSFNSPTFPSKPPAFASTSSGTGYARRRDGKKAPDNPFIEKYWPTYQDLQEDPRGLEVALNKHRVAQFVLTQMDRPIPSLDEMRAELAKPDDHQYVKDRIASAKAEHLDDLQRLYDARAGDYIDEALDKFMSRPEASTSGGDSDVWLEKVYNGRYDDSTWGTAYENIRYSYLTQLQQLVSQRSKFEKEEEELRRRFPTSTTDFRSKTRDVQVRVASFLTSDRAKQEKMLNEFGWAWRQVKPLIDDFEKDPQFAAEVRALPTEVVAKDPRRKNTQ